ncbi:MAG TPA: hypothetical protein VGE56_06480 [Rhodocyclaceae bacterium]
MAAETFARQLSRSKLQLLNIDPESAKILLPRFFWMTLKGEMGNA